MPQTPSKHTARCEYPPNTLWVPPNTLWVLRNTLWLPQTHYRYPLNTLRVTHKHVVSTLPTHGGYPTQSCEYTLDTFQVSPSTLRIPLTTLRVTSQHTTGTFQTRRGDTQTMKVPFQNAAPKISFGYFKHIGGATKSFASPFQEQCEHHRNLPRVPRNTPRIPSNTLTLAIGT